MLVLPEIKLVQDTRTSDFFTPASSVKTMSTEKNQPETDTDCKHSSSDCCAAPITTSSFHMKTSRQESP